MDQNPKAGYYSSRPEKHSELLLLHAAQSTDLRQARSAKNQLIINNEGFLRATIKQWFGLKPSAYFDYLLEEARILFLSAIENFDLNRDVSLRAYARYHLKELKRIVSKPNKFVELKDEHIDKMFFKANLRFENFDLRKTILSAIENSLTPVEKEVITKHFLQGVKRKRIASQRRCSEARICVIIKTALPKLKNFLKNIGVDPEFFEFN
jgi:RNA polymerase sigma factor (sigma-70 family)